MLSIYDILLIWKISPTTKNNNPIILSSSTFFVLALKAAVKMEKKVKKPHND